MPELPEVEVLKNQLDHELGSQSVRIEEVQFLRQNLRFPLPHRRKNSVTGAVIQNVSRRAKYLLFDLRDHGQMMISHLGMSGYWRLEKEFQSIKHDHICLHLKKGRESRFLIYNDPRRFGMFDIVPKKDLATYKLLKDLGPEPLDAELSLEYLFEITRKSDVPLKSFIMNQKYLVGVGNIYASESLFRAGIMPFIAAKKLKKGQARQLLQSIREVLREAIEKGGSTLNDYRQLDGQEGDFQSRHQVYGREKQPCVVCNTPVKSKIFSGRNTFWCPQCQK